MLNLTASVRPLTVLAAFGLVLFSRLLAGTVIWQAPDPEELADTAPRVDPEAGAEILFREVTMDSAIYSALPEMKVYVRMKAFSERGLTRFSKVEIPYDKDVTVRDIAARTIRPDGSIVALDYKDIFDREIVKADDVSEHMKTFAPPGLVIGAIVEYCFTKVYDRAPDPLLLSFQMDVPTRFVRFHVRPVPRALFFNCPTQTLTPDKEGFLHFEMRNVPGYEEEPFAPPSLHVSPAVLVYEPGLWNSPPEKYWEWRGMDLHDRADSQFRSTRAVKALAKSLVAPGDTPRQKVEKFYAYCCSRIVNRDDDTSGFTPAQRSKFGFNDNPDVTIKLGHGNTINVNFLFGALVRTAGLEAEIALVGDRSFLFFTPKIIENFALPKFAIAVKLNGHDWTFFDPGNHYLAFGQLYWQNTETFALVGAKKNPPLQRIDGPAADFSQRHRTAQLRLGADGTLEGNVTVTYTGLWETEMKDRLDAQSADERATTLKTEVQKSLTAAEVTAATFDGAADPLTPLKITYHVRVPHYAERAGSRMFVQPAVFQKDAKPVFDRAERHTNIVLHYRTTEIDDVSIAPPDGFELESANAPAGLDLGDAGAYRVSLGVTKKSHTLVYHRELATRVMYIPREGYAGWKQAFDEIRSRDAHVLVLHPKAENNPAPADATAPAGAAAAMSASPSSAPSS